MKKVQQLSVAFILLFCFALKVQAQQQLTPPAHAIKNVTIHFVNGRTVDDGTILWRDGIIKKIGTNITIPFDAYVIDGGDSLHVYPGFIDGLALWGSPGRPDVGTPDHPGNPGYKRAGIQPQRSPWQLLKEDEDFEQAQKLGFTVAALGLKGEMLPGQVGLFFITGKANNQLYKQNIGVLAQLKNARGAAYPSTIMGVMAEYQQLWDNAKALQQQMKYYQEAKDGYPAPKHSPVLEALFPVLNNEQPLYFAADSKEYIHRIFWLQDKLGFDFVLISGKNAYEKVSLLQKNSIPVLASFDLPDEPEWQKEKKKEGNTENVTEIEQRFRQRQLKVYKTDIQNIKKLLEAGIKVGYVSNGTDLDKFRDHLLTLHKDVELSSQQILKILTQNTADILGVGNRMGHLKEGYFANFSIFTKPFLEKETQVYYSVSNGNITKFDIQPKSEESDKKEGES